MGEKNVAPALFTRMLTWPTSEVVRASASSTSAAWRTSVVIPRPLTSAAAAEAVSASRSQMTTFAPNAASPLAMPRPIPAPPPVTTATLSVSSTDVGLMDMLATVQ